MNREKDILFSDIRNLIRVGILVDNESVLEFAFDLKLLPGIRIVGVCDAKSSRQSVCKCAANSVRMYTDLVAMVIHEKIDLVFDLTNDREDWRLMRRKRLSGIPVVERAHAEYLVSVVRVLRHARDDSHNLYCGQGASMYRRGRIDQSHITNFTRFIIENEASSGEPFRDSVTGLYRRVTIVKYLDWLLAALHGKNQPITVVLVHDEAAYTSTDMTNARDLGRYLCQWVGSLHPVAYLNDGCFAIALGMTSAYNCVTFSERLLDDSAYWSTGNPSRTQLSLGVASLYDRHDIPSGLDGEKLLARLCTEFARNGYGEPGQVIRLETASITRATETNCCSGPDSLIVPRLD